MHLPSPQIGKPTQYFLFNFFCCLLLNIYRDIVKKNNNNLCLVFANGGLFCINDTMTAVCDVSLLNQADICSNVFKNTLN